MGPLIKFLISLLVLIAIVAIVYAVMWQYNICTSMYACDASTGQCKKDHRSNKTRKQCEAACATLKDSQSKTPAESTGK